MSIAHAGSGETIDVQPLGVDLANRKSVALFKSEDLEVIRLVLLAGKSLPPHKVLGEITIQCIEGRIAVTVDGASHQLAVGQLLFLSGHVQHGVVALEDSSALVTIALRKYLLAGAFKGTRRHLRPLPQRCNGRLLQGTARWLEDALCRSRVVRQLGRRTPGSCDQFAAAVGADAGELPIGA